MRVLHVVRNLEIGGLERLVIDLASEQRVGGHFVHICELQETRNPHVEVPVGVGHYKGRRECGSLSGAHLVWHAVRDAKPDVVHVHNTLALKQSLLPCIFLRKPLVMTKHGMGFATGAYKYLYRFPDHVVCVSRPVLERLRDLHPSLRKRSSHVPNGIRLCADDHEHRQALRGHLGIASDVKAFVWAGRLAPEKGIDTLVQAFSGLRGNPGWELSLIGDGKMRKDLERMVRELRLEQQVRFFGVRQDVRALLPAFDVFVMPSRSEGLPIALLEAAAAGLPLIVSNVGDMPALVCRQNGWIVPREDIAMLAGAISQACGLDDYLLSEMGCRSRDIVKEKFLLRTCALRYEQIYRSVLRSQAVE